MHPSHLRYSEEHEWALVAEGTGTIGITEFAQHELGDIVYVELPEKGKKVEAGEILGTIESVKAVSEIYAPMSGEVIEVNASLVDAPDVINRDPHGEGWLCKMKLADPAEVDRLMEASAYESFIAK